MADLDPHVLAPEIGRRLSVAPDNVELLEAIDAAADDVLDYSGLDTLPDVPRVRRNLVPYAQAIFLAADAPLSTYGAVADDTFQALPVPADLRRRYRPRFAFLSVSWGVG